MSMRHVAIYLRVYLSWCWWRGGGTKMEVAIILSNTSWRHRPEQRHLPSLMSLSPGAAPSPVDPLRLLSISSSCVPSQREAEAILLAPFRHSSFAPSRQPARQEKRGRCCRVISRPPQRQTMIGGRAKEEKGSPGEGMFKTPTFLHPRLASAQAGR
jgi:hypothetical protein